MIPHSALATRFLVAALALLACTGCPEDGSEGYGALKVFIQPRNFGPFTDLDFEANASLKTPAGQDASFAFSWTRDGMPTGNTTRFVDSDDTTKNEVWTVTVTAQAGGRDFGPTVLDVLVQNSPPTARLRLNAFRACDDAMLTIDMLADKDGDPVTQERIEWFVNGVSVAVDVLTIDESLYVRGDQVRVEVTLNDTQEAFINFIQRVPFVPLVPALRCPPDMPQSAGPADVGAPALGVVAPDSGSGARDLVASADLDGAVPDAEDGVDAAGSTVAQSALSVSPTHVCSLDPSGALRCEGPEGSALGEVPEGAFAQVATGADYACALGAADGAAVCWGDAAPETGLLAPPAGPLAQLALGLECACALRDTGAPVCWGRPLGAGEALPEGPFVDLDVAEDDYFCAIRATGAVQCWGGE